MVLRLCSWAWGPRPFIQIYQGAEAGGFLRLVHQPVYMIGALQGGWGLRNDMVLCHHAHAYIAHIHERSALGWNMVKPVFSLS